MGAKEIGNALRHARLLIKKEVKEVSEYLVGMGFKAGLNTIYSWENGNSQPTPEILLVLCKYYGIDDMMSFFGYSDGKPTISKPETTSKQSPKKYPLLNEAGKEKVDGYIDGLLESRDYQLNPEPEEEISIEVMGKAPSISIDFYDAPVSAGLGEMLMDEEKTQILVPDTPTTQQADFCLRVKGDSMEPKYFDGDLVFVESREAIEEGQIGIFVFDGEAYIKKYTHEGLVSLNKKYDDILPDEETRVYCFGRVIGKI